MNKRKILILFLFLVVIGIVGTLIINLYIINSTKKQITTLDKVNSLDIDAILVLGCKAEGKSPSLMLARRLDMAFEVYKENNTKVILSGDHRNNYDEVDVMNDYFITYPVSSNDIILDYSGFSTYDSIYRAKYAYNLKKVIIVTQEYHLYRALFLANKLGLEAVGVKASDIPQKMIMLKNEAREILSRDKSFIYGIVKPKLELDFS